MRLGGRYSFRIVKMRRSRELFRRNVRSHFAGCSECDDCSDFDSVLTAKEAIRNVAQWQHPNVGMMPFLTEKRRTANANQKFCGKLAK